MFTITAASLAAVLAFTANALPTIAGRAVHTAPYGFGTFQLETVGSASPLDGMFLTNFHTGAGEGAAVLTNNQTIAPSQIYNTTTGDIFFLGGEPRTPFSLQFLKSAPYMSSAPGGYNLVVQNIGFANAGFSFTPADNRLVLPASVTSLAACMVSGVAPYFSAGEQVQLFWRNATTPKSASSDCSDVSLKAIFNHGTNLG